MDYEEFIPPQHKAFEPPPMDFRNQVVTANRKSRLGAVRGKNTRNVALGEFEGGRHVGKKRGRDEDNDMEVMEDEESRGAETTDGQTMVGKRRAYAVGQHNAGKASGRSWKAPAKRFSANVEQNDATKKKNAWDLKMQRKRDEKQTKAMIKEIKTNELDKVKAEKLRRAEVKKKKEDNRKKAADALVQKITNSKKLKGMSKKAQKGVRFVREVT